MLLRQDTNLKADLDLMLPESEYYSGFLHLYNSNYSSLEPVFMTRLWASLVFPNLAANAKFGKNRKLVKEYVAQWKDTVHPGLLDIRKVSGSSNIQDTNPESAPHFLISAPLAIVRADSMEMVMQRLASRFLEMKPGDSFSEDDASSLHNKLVTDTDAKGTPMGEMTFSTQQVLSANAHFLDSEDRIELAKTLKSIRFTTLGNNTVVFGDFRMGARIAQQLTTTPWLEIRTIDIYPLMLHWVETCFGYGVETPLFAYPISKVARTLPKVGKEDIRINEHNLSIDPNGEVFWLPEHLDNTSRYEDLYSQLGSKPDGGFRLASLGSDLASSMEERPVLPINIPVLIDWTNYKYAYTTSSGYLKVQDLSRFKTADESHIYNVMTRRGLDMQQINIMLRMAEVSGVPMVLNLSDEEVQEMNTTLIGSGDRLNKSATLMDYAALAINIYRLSEEMQATDPIAIREFTLTGSPYLRPLVRCFVMAHAAVIQNLDAVNAKLAVSTVTVHLGLLTLVAKYGPDFEDVTMKANTIRSAALNQKVDPKWTPPSIPLLSDKIGFLPHQAKVRNLLKDSPDFAILPVQAGGGKSVLAITDVLYEIKANRSQPYLILCPPHLVAQYVKEIVYFTSGQINAITINQYCLGTNGYERLEAILASSPRNTVVVCSYDVLSYQEYSVCYGTTDVTIYPVIEMLRKFRFGYAMLDESHSVKNDSNRTRACMMLISDIPKKRLASGTMAHDSPTDLAMQVAMMDPTLFGSRSDFNERYGETIKGNRVMKWKPGAQQAIMTAIKSRVVVAGAMRREWAALLPKSIEKIMAVNLTSAQQDVYDLIFAKTLADIQEAAKTNKTLQKFLNPDKKPTVEEGDENGAVDEDEDGDLASALGPYLARLEQFVTAPTRDELGKMLTGDDRISPKVLKIVERIRWHISNNIIGKVLVFTNYVESAEEIYDQLPDDIKAQAILYKAENKVETGLRFEKDARLKVMIGVEVSMNTGLNLQHVSHLIRTEAVWNPGTLEQGNSRVNRPELKTAERRKEIYFDWIMANRTIDITKTSRLISKIIAIGKFENTDTGIYDNIEDLPVVPMTLKAIENFNNWTEDLMPYNQAYNDYKTAQQADYAAYAEEYRSQYGDLMLKPVDAAPPPTDAALLTSVPYTPGLELYNQDELGLIRVSEYLQQNGSDEETGDVSSEKTKALITSLIGSKVHTEFGDGEIKSIALASKYVNVRLANGYLVYVGISAAFLISKPSSKSMRSRLLSAVSSIKHYVEPNAIIPGSFRPDATSGKIEEERKKREEEEKKKLKEKKATPPKNASAEVVLTVANGFLGLTFYVNDNTPDVGNMMQALGFRPNQPFAFAELRTDQHLVKQFNAWEKAGFTLDKDSIKSGISKAFKDLYDILKAKKLSTGNVNFNFSNRNQLKNFYRTEVKPSSSQTEFKPYPMIEDEVAYIVLPLRGQAASKAAMKVRVPGVQWKIAEPSLTYYGLDLAATGAKIKEILAAGIQISNIEDLKHDFKHLRKVNLRKAEEK